jgi:catechol-2,3-dioxygenase
VTTDRSTVGAVPIKRLNHAVLFVRDARRSAEFYCGVLGFRQVMAMGDRAVFLQAAQSRNDHDLGLFSIGDAASDSAAGTATVGLYHLAWEVDTLAELARVHDRLAGAGALVGASDHGTTKALYAHDPDGLEFEVSWLVPADRLDEVTTAARSSIRPLDIAAEIARYGAHLPGGAGVSDVVATPPR